MARGSLAVARETAQTGVEAVREAAERVLAHRRRRTRSARAARGHSPASWGKARARWRQRARVAVDAPARAGLVAARSGRSRDRLAASVVNVDLEPALARLLPSFGAERVLKAFAAVDRALDALSRNASPKIVADWVVLNL